MNQDYIVYGLFAAALIYLVILFIRKKRKKKDCGNDQCKC